MKFALLMGIPRSGTTLAAALLDEMPNAVCLSEPLEHVDLMAQSRDAAHFALLLRRSLFETHERLKRGEPIFDSRAPDGGPVTNYFSQPDERGMRQAVFAIPGRTKKFKSSDTLICSKHNALYTAVLPELIASQQFRIVALIRDPVDVLRSWRSLTLPVSAGKLPAAERYWIDMRSLTDGEMPLLKKQIMIYELHCRRYLENQHSITLLKYEDLVADPIRLADAVAYAPLPNLPEAWRNNVRHPNSSKCEQLARAVREAVAEGTVPALAKLYPNYGD